MTLIDGSIGFLPRFMWCGRADIPGMPSPRAQDYWGAVTFFGAVLKAAEIISAQPGSAQCGFAQPRLTIRCAHRSVRHHIRRWPQNALRKCDSSAGFCLAETMGLRSGGSGMGGASAMAHRHIFQ